MDINTTIHIEVKTAYGRDNIYVVSEPHKSALRTLTNRLTIDRRDIEALKKMGFNIIEPAKPGVLH